MREVDELWVGQIPPHLLARVEATFAGHKIPIAATRPPNQSFFSVLSSAPTSSITRAHLASELARLGCPFELLHLGEDSERYSYLPHLGIHRIDLNQVGEEILSYGQLEGLLDATGGSNREFRQALNRAIGEPWIAAIAIIREAEQLRVA